MFRLFNSLFDPSHRSLGRSDSAPIRAAVERVVDRIDPRLRALPHYRRILSGPVARAVDYLTENVSALPPAISLDPTRFTADPRLRAWFAGPDHLRDTLSHSPAVQAYLERMGGAAPAELFAALRMDRSEKNVLGMVLQGDQVMRDVPQIAVSFHNHRIGFPSATESETRAMVQARAFDYLIDAARQQIASIRARRERLAHQRRRLLLARGRALIAGPRSGRDTRDGSALLPGCGTTEEATLRNVEIELGALDAAIATIGDQLALVAHILSEPEGHMRLDRVTLNLDHMNIRIPDHKRTPDAAVTFNDVLIGSERRTALALISFPRRDLTPPRDLLRAIV